MTTNQQPAQRPAPSGLTDAVARFACRQPQVARDDRAATRTLLDTVAVALAAREDETVAALQRWSDTEPSHGRSVMWGHVGRVAPARAALLNGTAGHALDFDDACPSMPLHPSTVLWPALLAHDGVDPVGLVHALDVGNAVMRAVGEALPMDEHYGAGWHSTATVGRLGAVAALASLRRLDVSRTRQALGLAASMAGGSLANFGTGTKPLHAGLAARDAVTAVGLVQSGLTANPSQLEHPKGFLRLFGKPEAERVERVEERLEHWREAWVEDRIVKRYPSCYGTHRALDAALMVRATLGTFAPEDVADVRVVVHPGTLRPLLDHPPATGLEAKFNLEYTVARALGDGEVTLDAFTDEAVGDRSTRELARRVRVIAQHAPDDRADLAGSAFAAVRVELAHGRTDEHLVEVSCGDARNPMTDRELDAKLLACLGAGGWPDPEADELLDGLRIALHGTQVDLADALARLAGPRSPRIEPGGAP